jgi:hypothetical protein
MSIVKTVFQLTVLHEHDIDVANWDIIDVINSTDNGYIIGNYRVVSREDIPQEHIKYELYAVGNDGTFFDYGEY